MSTTYVNTIDSLPLYADRTEKDAAGNTITTTYATKSEIPTVPVTDVEVNGTSVVSSGVASITMPTVDQTYDGTSTNAQSGTAVAGALAGINEVPASSSTDSGKVLTVDSSGNPGWAAAQAPISAGDGIDITNNVISVDVDGDSLTNSANGLSVTLPVPATTGASQGDVLSVGSSGLEWTTPSSSSVNDVEVDGTSVVNASGVAEITMPTVPSLKALAAGSNITITEDANSVTIAAAASTQVNSDWNAVSGVAQILNKPSLATVATTGDYTDLSNKPTIPAAQVNSDWDAVSGVSQILNKPSLATVATTGDYTDLTNKPTIPAAQVNSDWNAVSGVAEILNKPSIPSATSDLTNDSGFITLADVPAQVNADWNSSSGASEILNKPTIPSGTQLVPAATSADKDKVLTVNSQGTPGWATVSLGDVNNVLQVNSLPATTDAHTLYLIPET